MISSNETVLEFHDSRIEQISILADDRKFSRWSSCGDSVLERIKDASVASHTDTSIPCSQQTNSVDESLNETSKHVNQDVSRFHDQSSRWSECGGEKADTESIHNKDVSRFHDDKSNWSINSILEDSASTTLEMSSDVEVEVYVNKTIEHNNQDVSKFKDQNSRWDKTLDSSKLEDKQAVDNHSLNATANEQNFSMNSTLKHKNLDVSKFKDQHSQWDKTMDKTVNSTLSHCNEDVSRFGDQDTQWTNSSALSDGRCIV